jgi:hypothetical protein
VTLAVAGGLRATVGEERSSLRGEILWYRMVAGGAAPGYVRPRPRDPGLSAILEERNEPVPPDKLKDLITTTTAEILDPRPTVCLGLTPAGQSRTP